jgi:hypothetical protein
MSRLTIECHDFRPFEKNSLKGFAAIYVKEMRLTIRDVAIHNSHGRLWASLPSRPQIKDGKVVTDETGKAQYVNLFEFDSRDIRDAFSKRGD